MTNVLFFVNEPDAKSWQAALQRELPDARVHPWGVGTITQCDYAVCWKPPLSFFVNQRSLKAIFNVGAGVDYLLRDAAVPRNVPIIRLDDVVMAEQMEEYVAWCALYFMRRLDDYKNNQAKARWVKVSRYQRSQFRVGIMGLGVLGKKVASFLSAMGFPVLGWSRSSKAIPLVRCFSGKHTLEIFLRQTDMLVCLLPLTHETRGILSYSNLLCLPRGAYVVNVARGDHMIEADLLRLLDEDHLSGVALDVFPNEPLPSSSGLWFHPKVLITPHIAATTMVTDSMRQIAGKIMAFERGESVSGIVCRERGY